MVEKSRIILNEFLKSVLAGLSIGLACLLFIVINNKFLGSICFSIGLIIILVRGFNLFTGKLCFLENSKPLELFLVWLGNFVGIILSVLFIQITKLIEFQYVAIEIYLKKMENTVFDSFILGVFCELLINVSVIPYKNNKIGDIFKLTSVVIGVFAFVICGFEHCIANMFYFIMGSIEYPEMILPAFLILVVIPTIGNIFGAMIYQVGKNSLKEN